MKQHAFHVYEHNGLPSTVVCVLRPPTTPRSTPLLTLHSSLHPPHFAGMTAAQEYHRLQPLIMKLCRACDNVEFLVAASVV